MQWFTVVSILAKGLGFSLILATTILVFVNTSQQKAGVTQLVNSINQRLQFSAIVNYTYNSELEYMFAILNTDPNALNRFYTTYNATVSDIRTYLGVASDTQVIGSGVPIPAALATTGLYINTSWTRGIDECVLSDCTTQQRMQFIVNEAINVSPLLHSTLFSAAQAANTRVNASAVIAQDVVQTAEEILAPLLVVSVVLFIGISSAEIVRDQARRRALEQEVQATKKEVEEKQLFLSTVSHENRNPLNAIIGMSELMMLTTLDETQMDYMKTILGSCNSLLAQVNNLLLFLKLNNEAVVLQPSEQNVRAMVNNLMRPFHYTARLRGIKLYVNIVPYVPSSVFLDGDRFCKVVENLVNNAMRHTEPNKEIRVDFDYTAFGQLAVVVSDQGCGIPSEFMKKVWAPFVQGHTAQGYGLGLSIVRRLVTMMQGTVAIDSLVGHGTTVAVLVPAERVHQNESDTSSGPPSTPGTPSPSLPSEIDPKTLPRSVLVVDDDRINRKVVVRLLESLGVLQTFQASNGAEAVEVWRHQRPQTTLMDLHMPVMDGWTAASNIRLLEAHLGHTGHTKIIAISAASVESEISRCTQAGMDSFVLKPVTRAWLYKMIRVC